MARTDFIDQHFTCAICGDAFTALAGGEPVKDPVCMSCGLRYSPDKRQKLAQRRKQRDVKR
jgi:transcription elongation factor Elf1